MAKMVGVWTVRSILLVVFCSLMILTVAPARAQVPASARPRLLHAAVLVLDGAALRGPTLHVPDTGPTRRWICRLTYGICETIERYPTNFAKMTVPDLGGGKRAWSVQPVAQGDVEPAALGALTPLAAVVVIAAMVDAGAVNVSAGAFWCEPFNVPFLVAIAATALLFIGSGAHSIDAKESGGTGCSPRIAVALPVLAVVARILTWILLNGANPIQFTAPTQLELLAGSSGTYPAVRIARIFRTGAQSFLKGGTYCRVHVDRRHQCRCHQG